MKIEINIDVEAIVREEIRAYVRENLVINNIATDGNYTVNGMGVHAPLSNGDLEHQAQSEDPDTLVVTSKSAVPSLQPTKGIWEYAPKLGRRRNKAEIAMHKLELEKGRVLTPAEKGETEAIVEVGDEVQEQAKQDTKTKMRIDKTVKEVTAEIAAEEAQEPLITKDESEGATKQTTAPMFPAAQTEDDGIEDTVMPGETPEETIPKSDDLKLNSLFS